MVSITGDLTGDVTGDPPNLAMGDLDAESGFLITDEDWQIVTQPANGTASIDPDTGVWTYTVDPAFFADLDNGEIVSDTFTVDVTATISFFGFPLDVTATPVEVTITIEGVCFTAGTLIDIGAGSIPVETLQIGDLVATSDNGLQPIRWIESSTIEAEHLQDSPALRPVRISKGSLGPGVPARDLLVSQQHRILVRGPKVELLFGTDEVLVAAKHLCTWPGIAVVETDEPVEYLHILLDRHEILTADGAHAESLFLGEETLHTLSSDALQELSAIYPDRGSDQTPGFGRAARLILRQHEARALGQGLDSRPPTSCGASATVLTTA